MPPAEHCKPWGAPTTNMRRRAPSAGAHAVAEGVGIRCACTQSAVHTAATQYTHDRKPVCRHDKSAVPNPQTSEEPSAEHTLVWPLTDGAMGAKSVPSSRLCFKMISICASAAVIDSAAKSLAVSCVRTPAEYSAMASTLRATALRDATVSTCSPRYRMMFWLRRYAAQHRYARRLCSAPLPPPFPSAHG